MAVDPSSLLDTVVNIAGKIQTLGNSYVQASDAWKDYPSKVGALCTKLNAWKKEVDDLGLSWDETVVKRLEEAITLLQKEEATLRKRKAGNDAGRAWGFGSKLAMTFFPANIDRSIKCVTTALDCIVKAINETQEIREAAYKLAVVRKPTLGFKRDDRYIRVQETEERVENALTEAGGCKVVWLYGGPGRGKSCLARYVALQVEPSEDKDSSQQSASSNTHSSNWTKAFDKVVYIDCGPKADISTIQRDLQEKLGRDYQALVDQKEEVGSTAQPILMGMLQNKRLLIICDDVWSEGIGHVQEIIDLSGRNVKFLVTSQRDLSRSLNCSSQAIEMKKINTSEARKILASHILGPGKSNEMFEIPERLQSLADEIIEKVDGNPLALACVATAIRPQNFQNEGKWQKVVQDFSDTLNAQLLANIHGRKYPHSFWVAMQLMVKSLTAEERKFFILVSSCKGPSVPEEVVEYFYKLLKDKTPSEFCETAKGHLEDRQLVQIRKGFCSLHSLLHDFINLELHADKSRIVVRLKELSKSNGNEALADLAPEMDIEKAVINMYLDDSEKPSLTRDAITTSSLDERTFVIEPVTRLLLSDLQGRWAPRCHIIKVFFVYMEAGCIDSEAAITLLQSSNLKCIAAVTDVLIRYAQTDADNNVLMGDEVINTLLCLMGDKDLYRTGHSTPQNNLLDSTAAAIYWLHKMNADHGRPFDFSNTAPSTSFMCASEEITTAVAMCDNNHLHHHAMKALQYLSAIEDQTVRQMLATPRLLTELIKILNDQAKEGSDAAHVLGNLMCGEGLQTCEAILSNRTALPGLVNSLTRDNNPKLQAKAAWALAILAYKGGKSIALSIISHIPESVERLVHALNKASNPQLQEQAAAALGALAWEGGLDLCIKISDFPTALPQLVSALELDTNPDFQANAAGALWQLVCKGGESIALSISHIPKSLERLVHALTKASNPLLQECAAMALGNLAWEGGLDVCIKISDIPTALPQLVSALEQDPNPGFQAKAAGALWRLVCKGGESIALSISHIPKSLERLVHALTKASNPLLQENAAWALGNLAWEGGLDVCIKISDIPTALPQLVSALERDPNPNFQAKAAEALWRLVCKGGESIALSISHIPKSLERLVHALTKASNPLLQENAAWALGNLAWEGGLDVCIKISDIPTALPQLVLALERDPNPNFQAKAARALWRLVCKGGESIALSISHIPKSLERLVHALTKASNPRLQENAALALGNLAWEGGLDVCIKISDIPTALPQLVLALERDPNPDFQAEAAGALWQLVYKGGESIALKISQVVELWGRLMHALTKASNPALQMQAGRVLFELAFQGSCGPPEHFFGDQCPFSQSTTTSGIAENVGEEFSLGLTFPDAAAHDSELRCRLAEASELVDTLVVLSKDNLNSPEPHVSAMAIAALTLIDPSRGQQIGLSSAHSFLKRGYAELLLGLYKESLEDLNEAWRVQPLHWDGTSDTLWQRITVKAKLNDFQGALIDANNLVDMNPEAFSFQERGVLKCMMNDLPGALMDLDEALRLGPDDYECLKHRGYVKFLMHDETGARADAEKALQIKPSSVDFKHYGRRCLGGSSVRYIGFQLR